MRQLAQWKRWFQEHGDLIRQVRSVDDIAAAVRYLSYSIDTVLLTGAMMLLTILPSGLFANGWLVAKIAFLVAYVGLGIAAFRPTRAAGARALLVGAAVLCFLQVYGIARAHDPLGWLLWLGN